MSTPGSRGGRHASSATRRDARVVAWLVVAGLVVAVGLGLLVTRLVGGTSAEGQEVAGSEQPAGAGPDCEEPAEVTVFADPAAASVVTDLLEGLDCVEARVSSQASDVTAAAAGRPEGVGLGGALPDVWIPSSSVWVEHARSTEAGAARIVEDRVSLASSPVVVTASTQTAERLGWGGSAPQWSELMGEGSVRVASTDPRNDAAALSALLTTVEGVPTAESVATAASSLAVPPTQGRSPAQMVLEEVADVMPTSELDVIRAQEATGTGTLTAGYDPGLGALDFPLVTFAPTEEQDGTAAAVTAVRDRLVSSEASEALQALGLRTPEGALADRFAEGYGVDPDATPPTGPPSAEAVNAGLDAWAVAGRRARILFVIDRSGSMLWPLPGGTVPKAALARDSVAQLVSSASPDTDLGLWTFTTTGDEASIERLVPLAPLTSQSTGASQRDRLASAVAGIEPVPGGDTPLFQAVLEAYEEAQGTYAYGRLNAIVVVTDGIDDHPSGTLTEEETLDRLRLLYDGMRPVRLLALGYGPETDVAGLTRLADVTGGVAFQGLTEAEAATLLARTLAEL
jgi:hypothetical protein